MIYILIWLAASGWLLALVYGLWLRQARNSNRDLRLDKLNLLSDNIGLQASVINLQTQLSLATPMTFRMCGVDQSFHPADVKQAGGRDVVVWRN